MSTRPVSVFLDSLVHASATGDRVAAIRHLACILAAVATGTAAVALMFATLALGGPRPLAEVGLLALLAGEIAVAAYLSRTGNIETAQVAAAALLTGAIIGLAATTGGVQSPALVSIALVPLDASLAGSRRALIAATAIAAAGVAGLLAATNIIGDQGRALPHDLAAFPTMMAILVASALALRMGWLVAGITRLAAEREMPAMPVIAPLEAAPIAPVRTAEVTRFVPKDRPRPEPSEWSVTEESEPKELRRA